MHLAPEHPRPHFDDRLCSRVVGFAATCPGHSGKETGGAFTRPPPDGKLAPVVGKDAGDIWQTLTYCGGHLGTPGRVPCQQEVTPTSGRASSMSRGRQGTLSLSGPCSVLPSSRQPTGAVAARWSVLGVAATSTSASGHRRYKPGHKRSLVRPWRMSSEGFEKILDHHPVSEGGEAVHCQHCVQWGWCAADFDKGCCGSVE